MIKTIKHFVVPGHGWYKVSRKDLFKMDILDKISSFSYQKGDWVYLEEDCDATIFFDKYKELFGELNLSKKSVKFLFTPPDDIMENWYDKPKKIKDT